MACVAIKAPVFGIYHQNQQPVLFLITACVVGA